MKGFKEAVFVAVVAWAGSLHGQTVVKNDTQIDSLDPGIKLFRREKMAQGNTRFATDNVVLFLHGATSPSTCDFDLQYKDYSWADWLAKRGYVVYMGDYRTLWRLDPGGRDGSTGEPESARHPILSRASTTWKRWSTISNAFAMYRRSRSSAGLGAR